MIVSINELFNSWINWPDSWEVVWDDFRSDCCDVRYERGQGLARTPQAEAASLVVRKAVRDGILPSLRKTFVKCSDCDKQATQYDHRDYTNELDVVPVCRGCNHLRGIASF